MGRLDQALATNEARLKVLGEASGQDKKLQAESTALVENALGTLQLKAGLHTPRGPRLPQGLLQRKLPQAIRRGFPRVS